jgi:hypothetical protein
VLAERSSKSFPHLLPITEPALLLGRTIESVRALMGILLLAAVLAAWLAFARAHATHS